MLLSSRSVPLTAALKLSGSTVLKCSSPSATGVSLYHSRNTVWKQLLSSTSQRNVSSSRCMFSTSSDSSSTNSVSSTTGAATSADAGESTPESKPLGRAIRKVGANRPIIKQQRERNAALEDKAASSALDWRIVGATVLHRYPVISADPQPWQTEMWQLQDELQQKRRDWLLGKISGTNAHIINENNPSYEEIYDSLPFKPAPRITEADHSNDRRSLERRLQDSLFLIVKRNRSNNNNNSSSSENNSSSGSNNSSYSWQFPQGKWQSGETMRAVGERVVDRAVGKVNRWFISNSPSGHYCYEYPPELQQKRKNFGAKVFFYRAQLLAGDVKLETRLYTDYAWIARDEVYEYFDPETAAFMQQLLLD